MVRAVLFIADLANDLLDQVLQRHNTGGAAVFIDYHC